MTKQIIKLSTKWGDDFYPADGDDELYESALKILRQRLAEGIYYYNYDSGDPSEQWEDRARAILEAGDGSEAWYFLDDRSDYEYEGVSIEYMH